MGRGETNALDRPPARLFLPQPHMNRTEGGPPGQEEKRPNTSTELRKLK